MSCENYLVKNRRALSACIAIAALAWLQLPLSGQPKEPQEPAAPAASSQTPAPATPAPAATKPAPAASSSTEESTGLYGPWSVEAVYWMPSTHPDLRGGAAATDFSDLDYPKATKYSPGLKVSFPVSRTGMLNVSGFLLRGTGSIANSQNVAVFGTGYIPGDFINTRYTIENVRISLEDLFYPFPHKQGQKFRTKTLWEVQYVNMKSNFNAATVDSSGNPLAVTATGSRMVIYPTFGMAAEYNTSRHFRFSVEGSGFGLPHHSTIWDAGASLGYHHGRFELTVGEKIFHFSTSAQKDQYYKATLWGPYVALRWYGGKTL